MKNVSLRAVYAVQAKSDLEKFTSVYLKVQGTTVRVFVVRYTGRAAGYG